jgi:hypothetical protein
MKVEIGNEAAQFPDKQYINGNFVAVLISLLTFLSRLFPPKPSTVTEIIFLCWIFKTMYRG